MPIRKLLDKSLADKALLVGHDVDGQCVYTAFLCVDDYYAVEHPWDCSRTINRIRLRTVRGYLFDAKGGLEQEFESVFDAASGTYESGWCRDKNGNVTH